MITVTLSPKAEAMLCAKAAREGKDPNAVATDLLEEAIEWYQRDFEEACEGIRRGLEDSEAGRIKTHDEVFAKLRSYFPQAEQ
jgi:predicted transcriptional regulator